ncbi:mannose-specific lectin-like [Protopterus annectens]|uniref:mannose-specific lectin-like n=1 Tax=Protopterus annectens TaxID=7888 RepID=UPI001CFA84F0|nr:mannose-specific lectin-like [Protopterus annectens]
MSSTDRLKAKESLFKGERLISKSGQYEVVLQNDGNFVVYKRTPRWASNTHGHPNVVNICMQYDNNLVIYEPNNPIWHSSTWNSTSNRCVLRVQDDGNLVIYRTEDSMTPSDAIWATDTCNAKN